MTWAGPLALLLVLTGTIIELDNEGVILQVDEPITDSPFAVVGNKKSVYSILYLDNSENEQYMNNFYSAAYNGYPDNESILVPNPEEASKDASVEDVVSFSDNYSGIIVNLMSIKFAEPSGVQQIRESNYPVSKVAMQCFEDDKAVILEIADGRSVNAIAIYQPELPIEVPGYCPAKEGFESTDETPSDEVSEFPTTDGKAYNFIFEMLSNILHDHIVEPCEQWWKDDWSKYLRQYIRDVKNLLKGSSAVIYNTIKSLLNSSARFCYTIVEGLSQLDEFPYSITKNVIATIQDLPSSAEKIASELYQYVVSNIIEICSSTGMVRVSIRKFMHNKEFRFNYFWYCFYTILSILDLISVIYVLRKIHNFLHNLLSSVMWQMRKLFTSDKMANVAVGTEPYDFSGISIDHDVLRQLEENLETEVERLDQIKELEEQLGLANMMAESCAEKKESLDRRLNLVGQRVDGDENAKNL